jgi:hypothetical protein
VMLCGPLCQMPGMKLLHLSVMFDPYLSFLSAVTFKCDPFNLSKPNGKFTYHQVVFTLHLCVSYGSRNKQRLLTYSINGLLFITEAECVYCMVRTESLYQTIAFRL